MRLRGNAWAWVAAGLIFAAGCGGCSQRMATSGKGSNSGSSLVELIPRGQAPIPDLPVPFGFKLKESKSRDYAFAGARFVDHVYRGRANKQLVKRFYERQMPINRWVLSTAMFVRGEVMLDFEKETERCRVVITDGSLFHPTYIKVRLWTSGRLKIQTEVQEGKPPQNQ